MFMTTVHNVVCISFYKQEEGIAAALLAVKLLKQMRDKTTNSVEGTKLSELIEWVVFTSQHIMSTFLCFEYTRRNTIIQYMCLRDRLIISYSWTFKDT